MKILGNRVLLKVEKKYIKGEDGNIQKDPNGNEIYDFSREGRVIETNMEEVKKRDLVYFNPYGAVKVESMETKKHLFLCVEGEDIYAVL